MRNNYARGADFERRVKSDLERHGWYTMRSAGSHSPADIVALRFSSETVAVQCKRDGRLDPAEWNEFYSWCEGAGAVPVMASIPKTGRGIEYRRLMGMKEGRGKQPLGEWRP